MEVFILLRVSAANFTAFGNLINYPLNSRPVFPLHCFAVQNYIAFVRDLVHCWIRTTVTAFLAMESVQVDDPQPEPQTPRLLLKLISAGFAFFVAGVNDGSLGSLIPYIREAYHIDTNMVSVVLVIPPSVQARH